MKKRLLVSLAILVSLLTFVFSGLPITAADYVHGIVISIDDEDYYFDGPPDGRRGEKDVPGHYWKQLGSDHVTGKHYNTGPFPPNNPQWWTFGASDGELLFMVDGIIDEWSMEKARWYASQGYVHYHELVKVSDGSKHPTKVIWLKHYSRMGFYLDGGPQPEHAHYVSKGVDYEFMPNWLNPYSPTE